MIIANSINLKGESGEKVNLPEKIFGAKSNPSLLSQAVRVYLSNQRKALAKIKTRGEVAKTTAKMYRQKGTGRARHGSYSAPIFVGGGKVFGPTGEQNYKLHMPKRMARTALVGALSDKAKEHQVIILAETDKVTGKTKKVEKMANEEKNSRRKWLLVVGEKDKLIVRAFRNLSGVTIIHPNQLNTYLVLACKKLVLTPDSLNETVKLYVNN